MNIKKAASLLFHRVVLVAVLIVVQLLLLVVVIVSFSSYFAYFYLIMLAVSVAAVIGIVSKGIDPGYKIAWIIPIMIFPVFGGLLYLIFGGNRMTRGMQRRLQGIAQKTVQVLEGDFKAETLAGCGRDAVTQAAYLERFAHCPVYQNTAAEYFGLGDDLFPRMLEELRRAERYIFLEYFIIEEGVFWDAILAVLEEKAAAGVDVRVIYDDVGCLFKLPMHYNRTLEAKGIRCCVFNRFIPVLSIRLNNRDHRKLCIIDGHTGFTGGVNLADEYINVKSRFGHWKDSAILLQGDAVWSMTVMFLTLWEYIRGADEDYEQYRPAVRPGGWGQGAGSCVQPYTDNPLDNEPVGETVYLNLISKAERYVYLTTPYLIVSDSVNTALCNAAKSGVDVRILTPHIPDKKLVFEITRSHYAALLEAGVRIFEYTPGFLHAKNFAVDDRYGTVGSVNLDYRSMFLHFEDGVWLCRDPAVLDIKRDFLATQAKSMEITLKQCQDQPWPRRLLRAVLRVFAPLL